MLFFQLKLSPGASEISAGELDSRQGSWCHQGRCVCGVHGIPDSHPMNAGGTGTLLHDSRGTSIYCQLTALEDSRSQMRALLTPSLLPLEIHPDIAFRIAFCVCHFHLKAFLRLF